MRPAARIACALAAAAAGACTTDDAPALTIVRATPAYGPLTGGDPVVVEGSGFGEPGAGRIGVMLAGRRPALIAVLDDAHLQLVTPPGIEPGPAELVIFTGGREARSRDVFRYSGPPVIESVSPAGLRYTSGGVVTVTGHGFALESSGPATVWLEGRALDVSVESDTRFSFRAPGGALLAAPDLVFVNRRGQATRTHAFRYVASSGPGLLLFGASGGFASYVDPASPGNVIPVPSVPRADHDLLTAVVRDPDGEYWAVDRLRRLGQLDAGSQRRDQTVTVLDRLPAVERVGDRYLAIDRDQRRLAELDLASGALAPFGDVLPCCGSFGLASDGTRLWLTARDGDGPTTLGTIDPVTGALGPRTVVDGAGDLRLHDLRWFAGRLYGVTDGQLVAIDPSTATATTFPLPPTIGRIHAIELVVGADPLP